MIKKFIEEIKEFAPFVVGIIICLGLFTAAKTEAFTLKNLF